MAGAKYTKWEDFVQSGHALLKSFPDRLHIERGVLHFYVTDQTGYHQGWITYLCTAKEEDLSCLYYNSDDFLKNQCDFDHFLVVDVLNPENVICKW